MTSPRVKIEVDVLHHGPEHESTEYVQFKLQEMVQRRVNEGWTLRSSVSRGQAIYLVYASKRNPST